MKHLYIKFAFFCTLFFAPVVFSGCWKCDFCENSCDCDNQPTTYYKTDKVVGDVLFKNGGVYLNNTVKSDMIYIILVANIKFYTSKTDKNILGGANLFATPPCNCGNYGKKGSKEKLKKLIITSNRVYQNDYPIGSNLAPLMSVWAILWQPDYSNPPITKKNISDFLLESPPPPTEARLEFNSAPTQDKKHIFTIRYELDNGEVYTYTTPEITFQ